MQRFTEVIKITDGEIRNAAFHKARMRRTAEDFFGKSTFPDLENTEIPERYRQGTVKCRIVYGEDFGSMTFEHYEMRSIRSVALVYVSDIDYEYKYEDRSELGRLMGKRGDCDDVLIVRNGMVTDISYANVVFKNAKGEFYTPSRPLLAGTKRAALLSRGVIKEREITVDEISSYEGFYVINAMIDIEDDNFIKIDKIKGITRQ